MTRLLGLSVLLAGLAGVALGGGVVAPEIDASTGIAALGLLGGGILILRSRRKK